MTRLKVVHIIPNLLTGGAERSVTYLVRFSDPAKFEVSVILVYEKLGSAFEKELEEQGYKIYSLGVPKRYITSRNIKRYFYYMRAIFRMRKILRAIQPDVLHSHLPVQKFVVPSLLFNHNIPVKIHTIRTIANKDAPNFFNRFLNWFAFRFLEVIPVSVSNEVARTVEKLYGLKSHVIYNGIDTQRFLSLGPKKIKYSGERLILINIARFSFEKNHRLLIEAFEKALMELSNMELWLVGDGSLRQEMELLVQRKGLADKVKFLGIRSDIPELLHQADMFVLSSDYEGFGLVVAEAMAAGVPVIATAVGGVPEVLGYGKYGILVPPGNAEALAKAIVELAKDEKKRAELSERGRKIAVERFDIRNTVREYEKLYISLLEKKNIGF